MVKSIRFADITFDTEFLFGTDAHGATIRFSRAERIVLAKLTRNPRSVVTRDDLLDALSGPGSDAADRNVDFVINRLRRKLGDPARKPRYIATQYGEGYVWIAERVAQGRHLAGAFLVVGPVRGLKFVGSFTGAARAFAQQLERSLNRQTAKESKVVLDEECPPPELVAGDDRPRFAVELSFVAADERLDCAVTLKTYATGQIISVSRESVAGRDAVAKSAPDAVARRMTTAIWNTLTYPVGTPAIPSDEPLAVRMHDAANLLTDTAAAAWAKTEQRLRDELASAPADHRTRLMLATSIHARFLTVSPMLLPQHQLRVQGEDEIEQLVLSSLPHVQDNPVLMMAAAKLLYFIDRGHRPLAVAIATDAFRSTTAFAMSFAILGQIRMLEGDIDASLALYDQGIELSRDRSEFHIYLLVLKCQALLASGRHKALAEQLEVLFAKKAGTRETLSIFFATPDVDNVAASVQLVLDRLDAAGGRAILVFMNYLCARLFRHAEHRENAIHGMLSLLVGRFGPDVVSTELHASVPALVRRLRVKV